MIVIINQFFGLGDIIFCQEIAWQYLREGHKVIWPVEPHFVEGLNRAYPDIVFIDKNKLNIDYENRSFYQSGETMILPLRFADSITKVAYKDCMRAKYLLVSKPLSSWRSQAALFQRSWISEYGLYANLNAKKKRYNLISPFFGSNSQFKASITVDNGLPNIELCTLPGRSLFDWVMLIENAAEIHAVNSSILYLLEVLNLEMPIHLYQRLPVERGFENVDYLFTKPYILH